MFFKDGLYVVTYDDDLLIAGKQQYIKQFFVDMNLVPKRRHGENLTNDEVVKFVGCNSVKNDDLELW